MTTTRSALDILSEYDHDAALYAVQKQRWALMSDARREGATWEQIGQAMGMTRQSAHEIWHTTSDAITARIREANRAARRAAQS